MARHIKDEQIRLGAPALYIRYPDQGMPKAALSSPAKIGAMRNMSAVAKPAEMAGRPGRWSRLPEPEQRWRDSVPGIASRQHGLKRMERRQQQGGAHRDWMETAQFPSVVDRQRDQQGVSGQAGGHVQPGEIQGKREDKP